LKVEADSQNVDDKQGHPNRNNREEEKSVSRALSYQPPRKKPWDNDGKSNIECTLNDRVNEGIRFIYHHAPLDNALF